MRLNDVVKTPQALPFLLLAEASTATDSWVITMLNYGVAGVMLLWFMWRDKRESEKQDLRHRENLEQQKRIEDAFRTNTNSIMVGMGAIKHLDGAYTEMLARIKIENDK